MKKFVVTVNGISYEVDVEEIKGGAAPAAFISAPAPAPAAAPAPAPVAVPVPAAAPAPAPAPAAQEPATADGTPVVAPMPGNIWGVNVNVGDTVKSGQAVCVLEAMKMENDIVAPCDGKVVQVKVSKGDVVDSGAVLVVIA